ncbi:MAG: hypothetical protein K1X94_28430 [Sandaracinaceae bacterium]|nr:hypothetical protein [Sandaracinaceae bacterium]
MGSSSHVRPTPRFRAVLAGAVLVGPVLAGWSLVTPSQLRAEDVATDMFRTRGRFVISGHGGVMTAFRDAWFGGGGVELGYDTMFHPHHEVGLRLSETIHVLIAPYSSEPGHWIGIATDYRFHPELLTGSVVPYVEVAGGFGLYFGCLVGDYCGGLGMHGELGGGLEIALDPRISLHIGAQGRVLVGLFGNGVPATLEPVLTIGLHVS